MFHIDKKVQNWELRTKGEKPLSKVSCETKKLCDKVFALQFSIINSLFKAKWHCFIKDKTFFKFI